MDFLKKHHEKVLLALALLILIGTAGYLAIKVDTLTKQSSLGAQRPPSRDDIKPLDLANYQQALQSLSAPALWTHPASNTFGITPYSAPQPTGEFPEVKEKPTIELVELRVKQFRILFRAYSLDENSQQARNIQINFVDNNRTYFISAVGEPIPGSPFTLSKFQHKLQKVNVPGIGLQERDVSEVTLEAEGQDPIVLVLNKVSVPNPVVVLRSTRRPEAQFELKRDQTFESNGESYKVVDITPTQVVILRAKTGETLVLPPLPTTP